MANETVRIIGLDPGLRRTGWGVITADGARLRWVAHGVVAPPEAAPFSERLLFLFEALGTILADHGCEEAAVEEVFVNVNPSSTLKLGHARAAVTQHEEQRKQGETGRGVTARPATPRFFYGKTGNRVL